MPYARFVSSEIRVATGLHQRRFDAFVVDLGMAAVPVLDLQTLIEIADDALVNERLTPGIEPGLVTKSCQQNLEALAVRVVPEVIEARLCDGRILNFSG